MKFLTLAWAFLNQNFVSTLLGALFFGLIASWLFARHEQRRVTKGMLEKVKSLLDAQIEENTKVSASLHQALQQGCLNITHPFRVSGLEVVLQGRFLEHMKPDSAVLIVELYDRLLFTNAMHEQLHESTVGITSALSNIEPTRKRLQEQLLNALGPIEDLLSQLRASLTA